MSIFFALYCDTCQEVGPQVARTAGALIFAGAIEHTDGRPYRDDNTAEVQWRRFLTGHEWHQLRLVHE